MLRNFIFTLSLMLRIQKYFFDLDPPLSFYLRDSHGLSNMYICYLFISIELLFFQHDKFN